MAETPSTPAYSRRAIVGSAVMTVIAGCTGQRQLKTDQTVEETLEQHRMVTPGLQMQMAQDQDQEQIPTLESPPERGVIRIVEDASEQTVTVAKRVFVRNGCLQADYRATTSAAQIDLVFGVSSLPGGNEVCAALVTYPPVGVRFDFSELPVGATIAVEARGASEGVEYTISGETTTETFPVEPSKIAPKTYR